MKLLSQEQAEIKSFCATRGINELLHFAKASQMPFILRYGLLTNAILANAGGKVEDRSRIDQNSDHVCLSVDFPNYKLFYKRRAEAGMRETWCILSIEKSLIWERSCIFFPTNAAKNNGREGRRGLSGIEAMYTPTYDGIKRSELIRESIPTDPQAEVLVPDSILPKHIEKIYFEDGNSLLPNESIIANSGKKATIRPDLFLPRQDWRLWQK